MPHPSPVPAPVHVFTGPTLTAEQVHSVLPDAHVHAPVRHGDLIALDAPAGAVVVIIDGLYHQQVSVRHKEILELVDRGVHVVGCTSMGALRAAELHQVGMVGAGTVFEMYRDGVIDADDEVAVVHLREGDLSARNVPLVGVRVATSAAVGAGVLSPALAERLVATCRGQHYTERSWPALRRTVLRETPEAEAELDALDAFRADHPEAAAVKAYDALATLGRLDELTATPAAVRSADTWRNPHVYDWAVEHRVVPTDGVAVSDAAVLRHRQVYDADFPATWRAFVVGELGTSEEEVAARWTGVIGADNPYLLATERDLPADEVVLRTLVRAFAPPRGLHDLRAARPDLVDAPGLRQEIARAARLNDETWWRNKERLVDRLPQERLLRHLAGLWACSPDHTVLLAAARDRGLASLDEAAAAVRPSFLRDHADDGGTLSTRWRLA